MLKCNKGGVAPMLNYIRLGALTMAVIFNSSCEAGMFTKKQDVVFFSSMQGKVLFKGVPVAKAKVVRRYKYDTSEYIEDSCVTNDEGMFQLPAIAKKGVKITPLVEFIVHQQLFVERNSELQQMVSWKNGHIRKLGIRRCVKTTCVRADKRARQYKAGNW
jgi:hypothetical protein